MVMKSPFVWMWIGVRTMGLGTDALSFDLKQIKRKSDGK
jgi:hypothetical protein